jgi:putative membrane protein
MVAICAMILPGISGAFILLIMGKYFDVTEIIKDLVHGDVTGDKLLMLATFACGCVVGILSFSKLLRWLLTHCHALTMAVLCGFMVGSLRKLWPFKDLPAGEAIDFRHTQYGNVLPHRIDGQVLTVVVLTAIAVAFVLLLDWVSRKHHAQTLSDPQDRA